MQITSKQLTPLFVLGLCSLSLLAAPTAEAKQFKKLAQIGQTIPGNAFPLAEIIQPTIGSNGQVAVILRVQKIKSTAPRNLSFEDTVFQGIYTIGATGTIALIEGGETVLGNRGQRKTEFSAPTISQGKVGYFQLRQSQPSPISASGNLRVGTATNLTTLQSQIERNRSAELTFSGGSNLAFVNGNGYYRDQLFGAPTTNVFGVINGKPQVLLNGDDAIFEGSPLSETNSKLRASSGLIVLTRTRNSGSLGDTTDLYERSISGGQFKKLSNTLGASCGLSVSQDNIVACFDITNSTPPIENPPTRSDIAVRFGRQGQFVPIAVPAATPDRRVSNPSISQKNVAFQVDDQRTPTDAVATIYFSQNGQAAQKVVATGGKLDGKTVKSVQLSESGRAIIDKSIVFTATFTDGVTALYRVDL